MSINPVSKSEVSLLTAVDFDFNYSKNEVSVTVKAADFATIKIVAHWEQFCEWATEYYSLAGYNWCNRTFTVAEPCDSRYEDTDYYDAVYDAQEWLSDAGFGSEEQVAFWSAMNADLQNQIK